MSDDVVEAKEPQEDESKNEGLSLRENKSGEVKLADAGENDSINDTTNKNKEEAPSKEDEKKDETAEGTAPAGASTDVQYGFDGVNHTYTDPRDNTVYIWDRVKNGWFPKIDDDFLARYQMSYGFVEPPAGGDKAGEAPAAAPAPEASQASQAAAKEAVKRKAAPQDPGWFDMSQEHNTKVYVSNLPLDITEQEFVDFMQKCGLVMKDMATGRWKVKLYAEPGGQHLKGDGLCTYMKIESVELALTVLDGALLKGNKVRVERAQFQMKGQYNPGLKPKKKRKKEKEREKKMQDKLLDWRPDKMRGERPGHERTIVIKNLFDPKTFDERMELMLEYTEDLREEAAKCGAIKKLILYDKHPEGVAQVTFSDPEEADICKRLLDGRWFGQRKISAETWDGKTKYRVGETEEETKQRLDTWSKFLQQEDAKAKAADN